jgi:hypothetical protein
MTEVAEIRYKADITAGALKVPESRIIASLLLRDVEADGWKEAIIQQNVLKARTPSTASRLTRLIRGRLETMGPAGFAPKIWNHKKETILLRRVDFRSKAGRTFGS